MLKFDSGILKVYVNERLLGEYDYTADRNSQDQTVVTNGFFCRGGVIKELKFEQGYRPDSKLVADIIREDNTSDEVVFHTGSEEKLYITLPADTGHPVFEFK
jgi:hypothetical protein